MNETVDPKTFWEAKILGWEESRYAERSPTFLEKIAGRASSSLRFRIRAAVTLLAPHVKGRRVVELGCGSGLLAEQLMACGAIGYHGFDISEAAIERARQRGGDTTAIQFTAAPVLALEPTGDAVVFSLGLFDWLSPAEISHVLAIGKGGHYLHAIAERRVSLQQAIHRLYVHVSYGYRTGGYVPQYHSVEQITGHLRQNGMSAPNVFRDNRMSFGIFVSDLPLTQIV